LLPESKLFTDRPKRVFAVHLILLRFSHPTVGNEGVSFPPAKIRTVDHLIARKNVQGTFRKKTRSTRFGSCPNFSSEPSIGRHRLNPVHRGPVLNVTPARMAHFLLP
jgi:hypothetical protein